MIREYRLGERSRLPDPREGIARFGKKRSHMHDYLDAAGGTLTLKALAAKLGVRPYDLTRRKTTPKGREGLLVWPEDAGTLTIAGDLVALAADWRERLDDVRRAGGEIEADELAESNRKRRSRAYRDYLTGRVVSSSPTTAGRAAIERSHEKRGAHIAEAEAERDVARRTDIEHKRFVKRFVYERVRDLGRIRLGLLQEVLKDAGGTPGYALPAAKSLGCTIERLPEYGDEQFVYAPQVWAA